MRFMLFFLIVSIAAIMGFGLAEDQITSSAFYQNYLHQETTQPANQEEADFLPIKASELPSIVKEGFDNSMYKDEIISQVYVTPAKHVSDWISHAINGKLSLDDLSEKTCMLALHGKKVSTQLLFDKNGKLIKVKS